MSEGDLHKGGLVVGLVAAVGMGGARLADDVVRVGARTLGSVDDIARTGARGLGGSLDDAGRTGARAANPLEGANAANPLDDAGRLGSRSHLRPASLADEEAEWANDLAELTGEVSLELLSYDDGSTPEPASYVTALERPQLFDLSKHGAVWRRLVERGERARSAPLIFVGKAAGAGLMVDGEVVSLAELGRGCWSRGTTCVFVACASDCSAATQVVFEHAVAQQHEGLEPFIADFMLTRVEHKPAPMFVAVAGGQGERELEILRPDNRSNNRPNNAVTR